MRSPTTAEVKEIAKLKAREFVLGNKRKVVHLHDNPDDRKDLELEKLKAENTRLKSEVIRLTSKLASIKRHLR
jgi:hypothetical protein